ncbi:MAG: molybdopterin-guanine dinucleotide biosynthesis protein B, partial [bacterium]
MPLWITVTGPKKTGKTSVIEALIPFLKAQGWRVATIKHTVHVHDFDAVGTDSYRHNKAGAERVGIISPNTLVLFAYDTQVSDEDESELLEHFFKDHDVVLCEGFRDSKH